jgi:DNA-directed RNA polymerase I subunit RPA1
VEITSAVAYDPLKHALLGGLYDPRLGPTSEQDAGDTPCATCALKPAHCPGHLGHIELAVPVYHPLLFADLVTLLRIKCLACHKLQAPARVLDTFRAKLYLLTQHRMDELVALDAQLAVAEKKGPGGDEVGGAALALLEQYQPRPNTTITNNTHHLTSYERAVHKELVKACISACRATKRCAHCGGHSPKIRQDASNKIFQAVLSSTMDRHNRVHHIALESALATATTNSKTNYDSEDSEVPTVRKSKSKHQKSSTNNNDSEDDNDDSDDNDDDLPPDKDDDDDDEQPKTKDKFMHAGEVQAQARRTWSMDPYLCNALFFAGNSHDVHGYQSFFMQVIPVPPSRFRPPMYLMGMAVEHGQTAYLARIVTMNEKVRQFLAAGDEPQAYTAWIDLQTAVNCFMDSSKDPSSTPNNLVPPGIKQLLERKEGLFRKNMMGKRVDYACRSVISPDPYVGTNEIGIPLYFASILTYPTPVTEGNAKEMRHLVERGPHQYPGARWVEMEGVRVDLSKMNPARREAIAAQLLTHVKRGGMPAMVGRQLRDGDYVLMNRQVGDYWNECYCCLYIPWMRYFVMHHSEPEMKDYDHLLPSKCSARSIPIAT